MSIDENVGQAVFSDIQQRVRGFDLMSHLFKWNLLRVRHFDLHQVFVFRLSSRHAKLSPEDIQQIKIWPAPIAEQYPNPMPWERYEIAAAYYR